MLFFCGYFKHCFKTKSVILYYYNIKEENQGHILIQLLLIFLSQMIYKLLWDITL